MMHIFVTFGILSHTFFSFILVQHESLVLHRYLMAQHSLVECHGEHHWDSHFANKVAGVYATVVMP